MNTLQPHGLLLSLLVAAFGADFASAQGYPSKVIHVHTAPAGSSSDFISRIVTAELTQSLGQPVVVDNRPGGIPLFGNFARMAPDGYTLLISGGVWVPGLMEQVPFDALRDFAPVTALTKTPNIL